MAPKKTTGAQATAKKAVKKTDSGESEPVYKQFKNKPVEAIRHLMKVKKGVAKDALYRKEIGYVDIAWGNESHGLKHIIKKHGWEFKRANLSIDQTLSYTFLIGEITKGKGKYRIVIDNNNIRIVIHVKWNNTNRKSILTSFLKIKPRKILA